MNVVFDQSDAQINFYYELFYSISIYGDSTIQLSDNLNLVGACDFNIVNETLFFQIKRWQILPHPLGRVYKPPINKIGISAENYSMFINSMQFLMTFMKRYFNTITFDEGIQLPFTMANIETEV
jgi:hypothetical protein